MLKRAGLLIMGVSFLAAGSCLAGGDPGACGRNELDGKRIPGKAQFKAKAGQVLTIRTPGGGGFGKPGL